MRIVGAIVLTILASSNCLSQQNGFLNIGTTIEAQFIVTDPHERRTGEDPRGQPNPLQGVELQEIPEAQYSVVSVGDSPTDYDPQSEDLQFHFEFPFETPLDDGTYTIETIGIGLGPFSLFVSTSPKWGSIVQRFDTTLFAVTDTGRIIAFQFVYSGGLGSNPFIRKLVTTELISGDTEIMFRLGWITSAEIRDDFLQLLEQAGTEIEQNRFSSARATLTGLLQELAGNSGNVDSSAQRMLGSDIEQLLGELPDETEVSSFSLFATHSAYLEQNSTLFSGDVGVNEAGNAPFLNSDVELAIGIGTSTPSGYSVKANQIKVKQGATVASDVYYNTLDSNGTVSGSLHTPLSLPLVSALPEFKTASPGTQNVTVEQNGSETLQPGNYGDITLKKNGVLTFAGGTFHLNSFNGGDNAQILFLGASEVRIAGKFDTDQGTYLGPQDTTTLSASQIVFHVAGINGSNGNLGATPKAAQIGIANTVKANFYVPNGTLWIRQNTQATGAFIGKDVDVGIGVKIWLKSAF